MVKISRIYDEIIRVADNRIVYQHFFAAHNGRRSRIKTFLAFLKISQRLVKSERRNVQSRIPIVFLRAYDNITRAVCYKRKFRVRNTVEISAEIVVGQLSDNDLSVFLVCRKIYNISVTLRHRKNCKITVIHFCNNRLTVYGIVSCVAP